MTRSQDPASPDFWKSSWEEKRSGFFLAKSQTSTPESWMRFFDRVGATGPDTWKCMGDHGERVSSLLFGEGLVKKDHRVLDVGSGVGTLSLPLARRGARVVGMDYSVGMLSALAAAAKMAGLGSVVTRRDRFESFEPESPFDLVAAAYFPPALSPEGLHRLEKWSRGHVAVVIGSGSEALPFRRELWDRLLDTPLPSGGFHLIHLMGYLMAAGRKPNVRHLSWPTAIDQPADALIRFYEHYFEIFGEKNPETATAIADYFESRAVNGRVAAEFDMDLTVVWWQPPRKETGS